MTQPFIEIDGFSKWYAGRRILSDVSVSVEKGETLAVIGKSGCGKSTLLRHVAGLEDASTGRTLGRISLFGDVEISALPEREILRRKLRGPRVGFLFQDGALFDFLDVEGNILWPLREHRGGGETALRERCREVLRMVDLEPTGELLRREVSGLSGGERKRVALARCIALEPEILLFDEPTAGLDPPTASGISQLINRLREGGKRTSIVTSHDMESTRKVADRIAWIQDGAVVFQGTFDEAMADPKVRGFVKGG
ncbi:MAG: ATP-binding cassette domain-containing protein [Planctomycetota bacterium]|nr:ATP-binding cassette domain-containing protein [Planctomycetota bacterium]